MRARTIFAVSCIVAAATYSVSFGATWESLTLSPNPTGEEVSAYLASIRDVLHQTTVQLKPGEVTHATDSAMTVATADKIRHAVSLIPPRYIDRILRECANSEQSENDDATNRSSVVMRFGGEVIRRYRSGFTLTAITAIAHMTDIPPNQEEVIFREWQNYPELVLVVAAHPWLQAADAHISPALVRGFDQTVGFGKTKELWFAYLLQLDTPNAWSALEFLLAKGNTATRQEAYWAVVKSGKVPKVDMADIVRRNWSDLKNSPMTKGSEYAKIAALNGITDALLRMADEVRGSNVYVAVPLYGRSLVDLVEPRFNDVGKVADYVRANRKKLVFDAGTKKYHVAE